MSRNSPADLGNEISNFLQSSRQSNLRVMKEIKDRSDIDIDSRSVAGQTALMFASIGSVASLVHPDSPYHSEKSTPLEVTDWLLSRGSDPTLVDRSGHGAIHYAVKSGLKDVTELLISANRSLIESEVNGWRPLHFAVANNHYDIADFLIRSGADVNAEIDHDGRKFLAVDLLENIQLEQDRKAMSELILIASRVTAQISAEGVSSPRARSLSGEKSEVQGVI
jgi:hypothetical protein